MVSSARVSQQPNDRCKKSRGMLSLILALLALASGVLSGDSGQRWQSDWHGGLESAEEGPVERFEGSKRCERYNLTTNGISLRIAGGDLAAPNMFPYQVGLLVFRPPRTVFQCGGALISSHYVLTAAHCIHRATLGKVYLGAREFANDSSAAAIFNISYRDFYPHEHYNPPNVLDDIGLIYLRQPAPLSEVVQPIALARRFMTQQQLEGEFVSSSGWGLTGEDSDDVPMLPPKRMSILLLRYVNAPVLPVAQCACYYLSGLVRARYHVCADGLGGRGSCEGDSGGPLTFRYRNTTYLVGITAFGSAGGCNIGFPSVYTRVTSYLDWIARHTGLSSD